MENKKNIIEKMKELNSLMEDFLDRMDMDECENSDEERMDEIAKEENCSLVVNYVIPLLLDIRVHFIDCHILSRSIEAVFIAST